MYNTSLDNQNVDSMKTRNDPSFILFVATLTETYISLYISLSLLDISQYLRLDENRPVVNRITRMLTIHSDFLAGNFHRKYFSRKRSYPDVMRIALGTHVATREGDKRLGKKKRKKTKNK